MTALLSPEFDAAFQARLSDLFAWRRDVRRFRPDPLEDGALDRLITDACLAPSVGLAEPWRFVVVTGAMRRATVVDCFEQANAAALGSYEGERAALYARMKLEGLREAPVHLAVFSDETTPQGHGLGRQTMPEMLRYSVVTAVHTLWLAARARGIGVGWVSILDPEAVTAALDVPPGWRLVAYLCIGYPAELHREPELARQGWEQRAAVTDRVLKR